MSQDDDFDSMSEDDRPSGYDKFDGINCCGIGGRYIDRDDCPVHGNLGLNEDVNCCGIGGRYIDRDDCPIHGGRY